MKFKLKNQHEEPEAKRIIDKIIEILEIHKIKVAEGVDVVGADLRGADLRDANLEGANLVG